MLHGRQSSFDNLINGFVSTAAEDRSDPALLLRGEMNRHRGVLLGFVIFRVGEKIPSDKSNAALVSRSVRSGSETYNNVEDKVQTGRDSAGF